MSKIQDEWGEDQAKAIAGLLDERANRLSMRTFTQLENARAKAIKVHQAKTNGHVNADGTLSASLPWLRQPYLLGLGALLCAAMVFTFATGQYDNNEDSDAFVLSADLPIEALVDRGFEPWLNAKPVEL